MMIGRYFTTQTIYGRNFVCTFGFAITNQTKVPLPERFSPCFQKNAFFLNNFFGFGTSRWAMPASAMTLTPCRTIDVFIPCLQMFAPEQFPKLGGMGERWKSRRGSRIGRGRREEGRVGGRWARTEFQSAAMVRCRGAPGETHCSRYNRVWNQVLLTKRSGNQVLQRIQKGLAQKFCVRN